MDIAKVDVKHLGKAQMNGKIRLLETLPSNVYIFAPLQPFVKD